MKLKLIHRASLFLASIAIALGSCATLAPAQSSTSTNTPSLNPETFFSSAQNYFTSFNTNYTWTNVTLEISLGYKQVTGVNAASTLDVQYDIGRWNVGAAFQFSGIGSPINAAVAQGGYAFVQHYDAKAELDLRAGYDWNQKTGVVEPIVFLSKKPTDNTFFKIGIGLPVFFKGTFNRNPTFYAETGFTY